MMPFSTLRPSDSISVTSRRPSARRLQCTTKSIQEATVGTTKALDIFSPASKGSVQILVMASCAEFAWTLHIPGKPDYVETRLILVPA